MIIKPLCCRLENPVGVAEPVFSWKVYDCADKKQTAYRIVLDDVHGSNVWDSGVILSDESAFIRYDGVQLDGNTKYIWRVTVYTDNENATSEPAWFITGLYNTDRLEWISADKDVNSPILYSEFDLKSVCEYATVNVCGLGFFELYINGKKVSDDLMSPVRTDYDDVVYSDLQYTWDGVTAKSVQYLTYEVSGCLKSGRNTVAIWLGNGWYRQRCRPVEGGFDYGDYLKACFLLTNGSEIISSNSGWMYAESPITFDNFYYGEIYDGRIDFPGFDTGKPVLSIAPPSGKIVPQICPPEKIIATYEPEFLGDGIYDAKLDMTGFAEITFRGKHGDKVEIYYSEDLGEDGELDFTSTVGYVEGDKNQIQKDVYILSGDGDETYVPRFIWHTYRYFKVSASDGVVVKDAKAHYVCTALKERGSFISSEELLNILHANIVNTGLSNLHGCVPMDCPSRERMGYTGDGQLSSLTMMYNFDSFNFYSKWIDDILDTQQPNGFVPHTAPFYGGGGGLAWGSSVAVVPWNMYIQHGDKEILERCKSAVRKWVEYFSTRRENGIVMFEEEGSLGLGDWCMPSKYQWDVPHPEEIKIPAELVNTTYFIYCIDLYCEILKALGETPEDWILAERARSSDAFNAAFLADEYAGGEQGCNIFPLFVDIVPQGRENDILNAMIRRIENNGYCFDTGMSGTRFLFMVLDRYGRNDIAMKMLLNTEYPSFGYMIRNGATALWETWEGTGSKNHTVMSSVGSWLYYGLAGIKPQGGYKNFTVKPYFADELDNLEVTLDTEYGDIALSWSRMDCGIDVCIEIPFNTTANVDLNGDCFVLEAGEYKYHIGG